MSPESILCNIEQNVVTDGISIQSQACKSNHYVATGAEGKSRTENFYYCVIVLVFVTHRFPYLEKVVVAIKRHVSSWDSCK